MFHLRRLILLFFALTAGMLALASAGSANHLGSVQLGHEHTGVTAMTAIRGFANQPQFYVTNEWANAIAAISYAPIGSGVYGIHQATTGTAAGVRGDSNSTVAGAAGVHGSGFSTGGSFNATDGFGFGVVACADQATCGHPGFGFNGGVGGYFTAVNGTFGRGVHGVAAGANSIGGFFQGGSRGVDGFSDTGAAVHGDTNSGYAGDFEGNVRISGALQLGSAVLGPVNSATRAVGTGSFFTVDDSQATIINALTGGLDGQRLTLLFTDSLTTLDDNNGTLNLAGDFTGTAGDTIELIHSGGNWYELGRSVN
jgi:hypothetical protein